jgi:transcriptional regulator of met regulon
MDKYLTPGTTVIKYSDVLADIQHQILIIYMVCGAFLFIYALFNLYVVDSEKFWNREGELPEQIKGFMDAMAVMFSLFVCLSTGLVLLGINI